MINVNKNNGRLGSRWILVVSILYFFILSAIECFSKETHDAIFMTAMSGLKENHLYELKKLLNGKDLVDIGMWGHLVSKKLTGTESLHYNLRDTDCGTDNLTCTNQNGVCLIDSIKYFYEKLMIKSEDEEKEKKKKFSGLNLNLPKEYQTLTDADRLKYLVSLISDMHQPFRLGFKKDNGGRDLSLTYAGLNNETKQCTVFNYFESELVGKMIEKYDNSWYGGWTHVNRIIGQHKRDEELFERFGIDVINIWAKDIVRDLCKNFYTHHHMSSHRSNPDKDSSIDLTGNINIDYNFELFLERWVRSSILTAGSRVAIIMNHIFENKKFSSLRKRSEFDQINGKNQYSNKSKNKIHHINAFLINLTIVFVLLLILCYVNLIMKKQKNTGIPLTSEETELQEKCN